MKCTNRVKLLKELLLFLLACQLPPKNNIVTISPFPRKQKKKKSRTMIPTNSSCKILWLSRHYRWLNFWVSFIPPSSQQSMAEETIHCLGLEGCELLCNSLFNCFSSGCCAESVRFQRESNGTLNMTAASSLLSFIAQLRRRHCWIDMTLS